MPNLVRAILIGIEYGYLFQITENARQIYRKSLKNITSYARKCVTLKMF